LDLSLKLGKGFQETLHKNKANFGAYVPSLNVWTTERFEWSQQQFAAGNCISTD